MLGLTRRQKALLDFIRDHITDKGYPPSFENMKDGLGLRSKSGIHRILTALEERGHIRRLPNRPRSIALRDDDPFFRITLSQSLESDVRHLAAWAQTSPEQFIVSAVTLFVLQAKDRRPIEPANEYQTPISA